MSEKGYLFSASARRLIYWPAVVAWIACMIATPFRAFPGWVFVVTFFWMILALVLCRLPAPKRR
jgi:uncharacterized membrane protein